VYAYSPHVIEVNFPALVMYTPYDCALYLPMYGSYN